MKLVRLQSVARTPVSHNPEILKQVMIGNGEVPHLTNFSQSSFEPGQHTSPHVHKDMWEVYLVRSGHGTMRVNDETAELSPGVCIAVEPGESHEVLNDGHEALVLTYFGIVVG